MPRVPSAVKAPNPWWVGVVSGMASYIDAAAIVSSGTALVLYQQTIGITPTEIGILSAALTFCIAIGALAGGRLGDTFGRRAVFIVTMAMIVAGAGLLVFSSGLIGLLAGTMLVGLGSGADLPVSLATISEAATDENRGKLISFSQILWFVGILATVVLATFTGSMGHLGGQILFGHVGAVALIVLLLRFTIPESSSWTAAHRERESGTHTVRAERHGIRDVLTEKLYLVPFLALLGFYSLTNLGANTVGQFSAYVAVNVVGLTVQTASLIGLVGVPLGMLFAFWFMRISDGRRRMTYYAVGAFFLVASYAVPAILGFSLTTIIIGMVCGAIGGAWAFEAIMKIWAQESFPTLLRSSAQGAVIAFARVVAASVALVTPALLNTPQLMYGVLTVLVAIGLLVGWLAFRKSHFNAFHLEDKDLAEAQQELRAAGVRTEAPAADA
ncbi:MFS transporter [Nonomuraea sp. SYSU D8015]|uniref:MFS transporter n=1 Tax=Nonomuraea sp. SYSU D8015 TaxID=2593644 RepID=UPI0016601376|nr:MFS transporter [Nonomuraea sp. SYSU D8015]